MASYDLTITDDWSTDPYVTSIEAESDEAAIDLLHKEVADYVARGEWSTLGGTVRVSWRLEDEEYLYEQESESYHFDAPIPKWSRPDNWCGDKPSDHAWADGGDDEDEENSGVSGLGGTKLKIQQHCAHCGLRRTVVELGSQRNPGEQGSTEYHQPSEDFAEAGHLKSRNP